MMRAMKVLIVGYGGMGREIERTLAERGHGVLARVDPQPGVGDLKSLAEAPLGEADVAIEFSASSAVLDNAKRYAAFRLPAVVGTTGWESSREAVRRTVEDAGGAYIWGANFSIGAHLYFDLVERAARIINPFPQYDIMVLEMHHRRKKDSPSGTALKIAERILAASERKRRIVDTRLDRRIEDDELHVASLRGGDFPGTHKVYLDSPADTIEITHTARNRAGFALGAVLAAEWLVGKRGFFQVEDFIRERLG